MSWGPTAWCCGRPGLKLLLPSVSLVGWRWCEGVVWGELGCWSLVCFGCHVVGIVVCWRAYDVRVYGVVFVQSLGVRVVSLCFHLRVWRCCVRTCGQDVVMC